MYLLTAPMATLSD